MEYQEKRITKYDRLNLKENYQKIKDMLVDWNLVIKL